MKTANISQPKHPLILWRPINISKAWMAVPEPTSTEVTLQYNKDNFTELQGDFSRKYLSFLFFTSFYFAETSSFRWQRARTTRSSWFRATVRTLLAHTRCCIYSPREIVGATDDDNQEVKIKSKVVLLNSSWSSYSQLLFDVELNINLCPSNK